RVGPVEPVLSSSPVAEMQPSWSVGWRSCATSSEYLWKACETCCKSLLYMTGSPIPTAEVPTVTLLPVVRKLGADWVHRLGILCSLPEKRRIAAETMGRCTAPSPAASAPPLNFFPALGSGFPES